VVMMCGNRSLKQIVRGKCGINSIRNLFPLSGSCPSASISVVPVFNASWRRGWPGLRVYGLLIRVGFKDLTHSKRPQCIHKHISEVNARR
jgi:hypothetical protein